MDKKTLADVQPGGRVKLGHHHGGEHAEPVWLDRADAWMTLEREWAIDGMPADKQRLARAAFDAATGAVSAERERWFTRAGEYLKRAQAAEAALAARPSPATCKESLQVQPSPAGLCISDDDRAVLQRLQDALPTVGINGWSKGVEVLERLLRRSLEQPSPDGQGDALTNEAMRAFHAAYEGARSGRNQGKTFAGVKAVLELAARQPVRIYGCCAQPEGELHTEECPNMRHLAARQPVGQEPVGQPIPEEVCSEDFPGDELYSGQPSAWAAGWNACRAAALAAGQPVGQEPVGVVDDGVMTRGPRDLPGEGRYISAVKMSCELPQGTKLYAAPPAQAVDEAPRPMGTAPTDGTLVRLLVNFTSNAVDDRTGPSWTIGANNDGNVTADERMGWQFAGWCWDHDHFTEGEGTPVGWLPLEGPAAQAVDLGQFRDAVEDQHAAIMDSWCGDLETKARADAQRERLLALIDSQA